MRKLTSAKTSHGYRNAPPLVYLIATDDSAHKTYTEEMMSMTFEFDLTLTSVNGCQFHIHGTYTSPVEIGEFEFHGTVAGAGGDDCPDGITVFNQDELARATLIPVLDTTDIKTLSKITWQGSNKAVTAFLNASTTNSALCNAIRLAAAEAA